MVMPESLQAARLRVAKDRPYLNAILWSLTPVAKPGLGTFAVDRYLRLYYDPDIDKVWTMAEQAGALQHEVYHILRAHHDRAESMAAHNKAWNIAGDLEINDDLVKEQVTLPEGVITPSLYQLKDGETAEWYYNNLPTITINGPKQPGNAPGKDGKKTPGSGGQCGSCSGDYAEWEDNAPGEKNADGSNSAPGISDHEGELLKRQVAVDIQSSNARGTVPEWLQRWAKDNLNPKVNWRKELAAQVRRTLTDIAGAVDYSYKRLGRRASTNKRIVFPALRQPVPNVAVVVDTSGSMSEEALTVAMTEIKGILKQCGLKDGLTAVVCDAGVKSAKRVFTASAISLSGGGGTDMRIGIAQALRQRPTPHAVIVLTDGYTPWPDHPISGRLIIGVIGGYVEGIPGWAKAIEIRD